MKTRKHRLLTNYTPEELAAKRTDLLPLFVGLTADEIADKYLPHAAHDIWYVEHWLCDTVSPSLGLTMAADGTWRPKAA